ncbi:MAG: YdcF family protein [Butyrivibrio sp.]|nr:YdcF family protein [Butyrivibrio sp.]
MKKTNVPRIQVLWLVLAVLCLLYSVLVYMVGSGTFSFVIWLFGAAFFAVCFFLAGNGRWMKVPSGLRIAAYSVLGIIAFIFLVCQIAILSNFFDKGEKNLDYVIVLGAQMRDSGPSVIYSYRLQKAKEYMLENPETICITTGGQGSNESVSEGEGGATYLTSLGVPVSRILVEKKSMTTPQNIAYALEMIEDDRNSDEGLRIGIITNGFHVFRSVHIAKRLTNAHVSGVAAYMQPQYIPNNMVRETFGIIRDFLTGQLVF